MATANDQGDVLDLHTFISGALPQKPERTEPAPPAISRKSKVVPKEMPITVGYLDPLTGENKQFDLISRVPNFDVNTQIARAEARLCGPNIAFTSMSLERQIWVKCFARVTYQLVNPSKEALSYLGANQTALEQVAAHCMAHEQLFFRAGAASSGATQSGTGVVVTSAADQWVEEYNAGEGQ